MSTLPTQSHAAGARVVIIGGGFAGLEAARRLGGTQMQVTLVDQRNHHVFQPLLYQVATSGLAPQDIAWPLRASLRGHANVRVRLGTVTHVDWDERRVCLADGGELAFDQLVIAAGAVTTDFGVPGVQEHAWSLKDLDDATRLRNHLVTRFERATLDPAAIVHGALRFVIAGGGPTGVELAGALVELVAVLRRDFPEVDGTRAEIVLVEQGASLLPGFDPTSRSYAANALRRRGVDVRLSTGVDRVDAHGAVLSTGEAVASQTVLWTAGVRAHPLAEALDVELTRGGRIVVDERLRLPAHPEAFAIGDIAAGRDRDGGLLPQTAPVAIQQGRHVAAAMTAASCGRETAPFQYADKGSMATIGRHAAVAELGHLRLRGLVAWASWLLVHLLYLAGLRNRASVLLQWTWGYLTHDRSTRAVLGRLHSEPHPTAATSPSRAQSASRRAAALSEEMT